MHHPDRIRVCLLIACLASVLPAAHAAGARTGVQPSHGEMVLLRDVNARHAVRPAPQGIGLIVDPTPNRQLLPALSGELSDADFLALDTGQQVQDRGPGTGGLASPMVRTLAGPSLGGSNARDASGVQSAGSLGAAAGGPLGAVGQVTRGIGGQVTGALSQLPFGPPPQGSGP